MTSLITRRSSTRCAPTRFATQASLQSGNLNHNPASTGILLSTDPKAPNRAPRRGSRNRTATPRQNKGDVGASQMQYRIPSCPKFGKNSDCQSQHHAVHYDGPNLNRNLYRLVNRRFVPVLWGGETLSYVDVLWSGIGAIAGFRIANL
jgi:hypothetical protein